MFLWWHIALTSVRGHLRSHRTSSQGRYFPSTSLAHGSPIGSTVWNKNAKRPFWNTSDNLLIHQSELKHFRRIACTRNNGENSKVLEKSIYSVAQLISKLDGKFIFRLIKIYCFIFEIKCVKVFILKLGGKRRGINIDAPQSNYNYIIFKM